ncbi:MAG TPA: hypothetical protein VF360_07835 [Candidatus Methanoperedens sp.]
MLRMDLMIGSNILSKWQIELRRVEIYKRVKEALKAYKDGNIKSGNLEELWKDQSASF